VEDRMELPRRRFLHLAAGAAGLPVVARVAQAQTYPSRPVRIVSPFAASGGNDIHARLFAQVLSERLGQSFVVENRVGGGGSIGTAEVVRAAPDGYTLLAMSVGMAINAAYSDNLPYDFLRDIAPVASFYRAHFLMLVHPSLPVRTVPEFIAYAKTHAVNMGSNGMASTGQLAGEMFKMMTGINMQHVPYRGEGAALTDLIGAQLHVVFASMTSSTELVRSGQLRALATTGAARSPALPDVPVVAEFVPGYQLASWAGMGAPRNTPPAIIDRLNKEINAGLERQEIIAKYTDLGGSTFATSPAEFGQFLNADVAKWAKLIKFAGIKPA
jgi:tripartite-type tricarboxylate transporter receptor subunit TctC